ncbi:MAG: gamma-glutamyltransferase family protein [Hyphomicrobiaceae bacterium]
MVRTCIALTGLAICTNARAQLSPDIRLIEPEARTSITAKPSTIAQRHMIVAANPLAADAGLEILRAGGSAVDAVIAAQMVLTLVEPQSSGIGGGAFLLHWDAKSRAVSSIDGRETAPISARSSRFLADNGEPRPFGELVSSPLSVGVPGVVAAMELAHQRFGKLAWRRLFDRAIELANDGFAVSHRLSALLTVQGPAYFNQPARALYFDTAGVALKPGMILKNPALAASLREIADHGADAFYRGALTGRILDALGNNADLTAKDLATYTAKDRDPVCAMYRRHRVCSMGPPSSGGITMGMVLGMIEAHGAASATPQQVVRAGQEHQLLTSRAADIAVLAEAQKLAYADRDQFVADPDFVPQTADLLDRGYLASRAKRIDPSRPMVKAPVGAPPLKTGQRFGTDATVEQPGTSHLSVLDGKGNGVAMTTSVQTAFGSGIMAGGFLLNSQLTDFSFRPADTMGVPIANRVEGGKRPRSSMAPAIVLDPRGELFALLGSPGGNRIILYNLKAIICLIDWHCSVELAASLPNFGSRNGPIEVESGTAAQVLLGPAFSAAGASVAPSDMTSGLGIIERRDGIVEGAADPRREGEARGD